jgi:MoaD family protein
VLSVKFKEEDKMKVKVRYFTLLREIAGRNEEGVELDAPSEVKCFLQKLARKYGKEFERFVFGENGELKRYLIFVLNGKALSESEVSAATLKDGDELSIMPVAGGG